MPTEFKIPELGENVTGGEVVRVMVKAGDTIEKDQAVLELETDKATIEVPSSVSGTVQEVKVKQGDKIKVGQVVLTLADGAAAAPAAEDAGGDKAKPDQPASDKPVKGAKGTGPAEKKGAAAEVKSADTGGAKPQPDGAAQEGGLSQAATPERTGEDAGPPAESAGEPADGGQPRQKPRGEVVDINRGARPAQAPAAAEPASPAKPAAPAAPSVRRLARELGVDIAVVVGTGPEGRISTEDVQMFVRN